MEPLFASIGVAVIMIGTLYPAVRILVIGLERTLKRLSKGALGSTRRGHQVELTWEEDRYQRILGGNAGRFHIQMRAPVPDIPRALVLSSHGAVRHRTTNGRWRLRPSLGTGLNEDPGPTTPEESAIWNQALFAQLPKPVRALMARYPIWIDHAGVLTLLDFDPKDRTRATRARLEAAGAAVRQIADALEELELRAPTWAQGALELLAARPRALLLRYLCETYRGHAATVELCRDKLERGERGEQLVAALHLGGDELLRLPQLLDEQEVPIELWREALIALGTRLEGPALTPLYERALQISDQALRRLALRRLLRLGAPLRRELVELLAANSNDAELLRHLLGSLPEPGSAWWQARLLEVLQRWFALSNGRERLLRQALDLLAADGDAPAVAALRELEQNPALPAALRAEARSAANMIRERIGEVTQGALALVQATGGGELSVASDAGALELVDDPGTDEG